MILSLPDRRQKDTFDCGCAARDILLDYWQVPGKRRPLSNPIDGTDPRALEAALRAAGLAVQAGEMTLDDLRYHTRAGRPVACLVVHEDVGHWLVVGGLVRGRVYRQCPLLGWGHEPAGVFDGRWHDMDRLGVRFSRWGVAAG